MVTHDAQNLRLGRRRWSKGQSMVEMTAVMLYWIGLLFGIASACLGVYGYSFVSQAARDAVRYAIVLGADVPTANQATLSSVQSFVIGEAHGISISPSNISATWTPDNKPGSVVKVTVTYNYQPLYPFSSVTLPLSSSAQMVIVY